MNLKKFTNFIKEELTGKYAEETEIIYKDKNIVCMLPKSQMTSKIYGKDASWCQTTIPGFDMWTGKHKSEKSLLIRFLIKGGRKIRFTYFPNKKFYWANESGWHVLEGEGNPFEVQPPKDKIRDVEKDILGVIRNMIPQECKEKVLDFIEKNLKDFKYIYRDENYIPQHLIKFRDEYKKIEDKYYEILRDISRKGEVYIGTYFDKNKINLEYKKYGQDSSSNYINNIETFDKIDEFENRLKEIIRDSEKDK